MPGYGRQFKWYPFNGSDNPLEIMLTTDLELVYFKQSRNHKEAMFLRCDNREPVSVYLRDMNRLVREGLVCRCLDGERKIWRATERGLEEALLT